MTLSSSDFAVKGAAPLLRTSGGTMAVMFGYGLTRFETNAHIIENDRNLHRFDAQLVGGVPVSARVSLRGIAGATYASDMLANTSLAWQATAAGMVNWIAGPSDALFAGAVFSTQSTFFPVLPILGYVHQREGSPFRFELFIPRHVRADYDFHPRVRGSLGLEAAGNAWAVQGSTGAYARVGRRQGARSFAAVQMQIVGPLRIETRAGVSLYRYELESTTDQQLVQLQYRPAGFAQLALLVAP